MFRSSSINLLWKIVLFFLLFLGLIWFGMAFIEPKFGSSITGWIQTSLALLAFPIILYQLNQMVQSVNNRPLVSIGIIGGHRINLADLNRLDKLPTSATLQRRYYFSVVIKNSGNVDLRPVKITLRFISYMDADLLQSNSVPWIESPEYKTNKNRFEENANAEFIFRPPQNWALNAHDIESFQLETRSTSIDMLERRNVQLIEDQNSNGIMTFECSIWADGLSEPITQLLRAKIL